MYKIISEITVINKNGDTKERIIERIKESCDKDGICAVQEFNSLRFALEEFERMGKAYFTYHFTSTTTPK